MITAVPRAMERDEGPAVAEMLGMLGVTVWVAGLLWLAIHLAVRAHDHHAHRQVHPGRRGHP